MQLRVGTHRPLLVRGGAGVHPGRHRRSRAQARAEAFEAAAKVCEELEKEKREFAEKYKSGRVGEVVVLGDAGRTIRALKGAKT